MQKITKRTAIIAATAVAAVSIGGVALAAAGWLSSGTGSGTATAGEAQDIAASASVTGQLYPGAQRPLAVTLTNPNPYPVRVTGGAVTLTGVTGAPGCTPTNAAVAVTLPASFTGIVIPAATGETPGRAVPDPFANAVAMGDSDNACQNATLHFAFTGLTGVSSAG